MSLVLVGGGCIAQDTWTGFYYPDIEDMSFYEESGELSSLEDCRSWVAKRRLMHSKDWVMNDDYECGTNCHYDPFLDLNRCDETVQ